MKILRHEKFKDIRFLWTSTRDKPVSNSQRNDKKVIIKSKFKKPATS